MKISAKKKSTEQYCTSLQYVTVVNH